MKKLIALILMVTIAFSADVATHISDGSFSIVEEKSLTIDPNQVRDFTVQITNNDTQEYDIFVEIVGDASNVVKTITNSEFTLSEDASDDTRFQFGSNEVGSYEGYITYRASYDDGGQTVTIQGSFPIQVGVGQIPEPSTCSINVYTDKDEYGIGENMLITAGTNREGGEIKFLIYDPQGRLVSSQETTPGSNKQAVASFHVDPTLVGGDYQINVVFNVDGCFASDYERVELNTGIEGGEIPLKLKINAAYAPMPFETCDITNKSGVAYEVCVNGSLIEGQTAVIEHIDVPSSEFGQLTIGVSQPLYTLDQYNALQETVSRLSKNNELLTNVTQGNLFKSNAFWANQSLRCKDEQIPDARAGGYSDGFFHGILIGLMIGVIVTILFAKILGDRRSLSELNIGV